MNGLISDYRMTNEEQGHHRGCAWGAGADCTCGAHQPASCIACDCPDYIGCDCDAPYMTDTERAVRRVVLTYTADGRELYAGSWGVERIEAAKKIARKRQDSPVDRFVYRLRYMRRDVAEMLKRATDARCGR